MRNSSRTWLGRDIAQFAAGLPQGSIVLDAGAGNQLYKSMFSHCQYEAADFERVDKPYAKSTYVCDLRSIPTPDERFDAILFTQTMEHLLDPGAALKELYRVLKPGARIFCSAPLFYEEHEQPYDYFRYTQFAWRKLLADAGFVVENLTWVEGYFGTVAYQLEAGSKYLPRRPSHIAPGMTGLVAAPFVISCRVAFRVLAAIFYRLDERNRYTGAGHHGNSGCGDDLC